MGWRESCATVEALAGFLLLLWLMDLLCPFLQPCFWFDMQYVAMDSWLLDLRGSVHFVRSTPHSSGGAIHPLVKGFAYSLHLATDWCLMFWAFAKTAS